MATALPRDVLPSHGGGLTSNFHTTRQALELSFQTPSKPFLGRIHPSTPPSSPPLTSWLTYGDVSGRVRPLAALLDTLASLCEFNCLPIAEGASRPFLAIGGHNSVEWVCSDFAATGVFLPTVGLHPDMPARSVVKVFSLTLAPILVLTDLDSLERVCEAGALWDATSPRGASVPFPLRHLVLLDPHASLSRVQAAFAPLLTRFGVRLWHCDPSTTASSSSSPGDNSVELKDVGTVLPSSLLRLALGALEEVIHSGGGGIASTTPPPPSLAPHSSPLSCASQWHALLKGGEEGNKLHASTPSSLPHPLFIHPSRVWLGSASRRELERQRASPWGPLYHPLVTQKQLVDARGGGLVRGERGAVLWVLAGEEGEEEAVFDTACLWSIVFSTGSGGVLKATPYSRACWASNCGANSGVCDLGDPLNKTVVSHCAMSHGLDRGAYWRAALVQGCVGMSRGEGFEEVYEALRVFQPFQFCTMPCFWEALYKHAMGRMEGVVRCKSGGGVGDLPTSPTDLPPTGTLTAAALLRPLGSLSHALTSVVEALRGEFLRSDGGGGKVKWSTGGAPCSWEVITFFNWLVFNGNFSNAYAATEASPIASGSGSGLEVDSAFVRVSGGGGGGRGSGSGSGGDDCHKLALAWAQQPGKRGEDTEGWIGGELEAMNAGGARRYFGADSDAEAGQATRSSFTSDGFWKSGDIVELYTVKGHRDRYVRVLGRKGDTLEIYTEGGSAWAPHWEVQAALSLSPAVHKGQVVVHCSRATSTVIAVLVPCEQWVATSTPLLASHGVEVKPGEGVLDALGRAVKHQGGGGLLNALKASVLQSLKSAVVASGLEHCWIPLGVVLDFVPWSRENGRLLALGKPPSRKLVLREGDALHSSDGMLWREACIELTRVASNGEKEGGGNEGGSTQPTITTTHPPSFAPSIVTGAINEARAVAMNGVGGGGDQGWLSAWKFLLSHSRPPGAASTPSLGLLADLWSLVEPSLPLPLTSPQIGSGDSGTLLFPPRSALGTLWREVKGGVKVDFSTLSSALSSPAVLPGRFSGMRVTLHSVHVDFPVGYLPRKRETHEFKGDLVVACLHNLPHPSTSLDSPPSSSAAAAAAAGEGFDLALSCVRTALGVLSVPTSAWPVALLPLTIAEGGGEGGGTFSPPFPQVSHLAQSYHQQWYDCVYPFSIEPRAREPMELTAWKVPTLGVLTPLQCLSLQQAWDAMMTRAWVWAEVQWRVQAWRRDSREARALREGYAQCVTAQEECLLACLKRVSECTSECLTACEEEGGVGTSTPLLLPSLHTLDGALQALCDAKAQGVEAKSLGEALMNAGLSAGGGLGEREAEASESMEKCKEVWLTACSRLGFPPLNPYLAHFMYAGLRGGGGGGGGGGDPIGGETAIDTGSISINGLLHVPKCALLDRELGSPSLDMYDWPDRYVSMDSSVVLCTDVYTHLSSIMDVWDRVKGEVVELLSQSPPSSSSSSSSSSPPPPHNTILSMVTAIGRRIANLCPDLATGCMFVKEWGFSTEERGSVFTASVPGSSMTTPAPTPAHWVGAAFQCWGERPCLGIAVDFAQRCCMAHLKARDVVVWGEVASPTATATTTATTPTFPHWEPHFTLNRNPEKPHLLPFAWLSYKDLAPLIGTLASSLRGLHKVYSRSVVGICATNVPEWLLVDWAGALGGLCPVGFHTTYTVVELSAALALADPTVAVVAESEVGKWLACVRGGYAKRLTTLILMVRPHALQAAIAKGEEWVVRHGGGLPPRFASGESSGSSSGSSSSSSSSGGGGGDSPLCILPLPTLLDPSNPYKAMAERRNLVSNPSLAAPGNAWTTFCAKFSGETPPTPDEFYGAEDKGRRNFTLLFTSGTSGKAKGVVIDEECWRRDIGDAPGQRNWPGVHITCSFIPLSHSSDRVRCWDAIGRGGRIGFCFYDAQHWGEHERGKKDGVLREGGGSSNGCERLVEDVAALHPTSLAFPPRIWSGLKYLCERAREEASTPPTSTPIPPSVAAIFQGSANLFDALGGKIVNVGTGGAAPDPDVMAWVQKELPNCPYQESYGCTECGAITENGVVMGEGTGRGVSYRLEPIAGVVGGGGAAGFPFPRFGEMVVKTPTMARGYLKDEAATRAAFLGDGYWRTGDICEALPSGPGHFRVVERVSALCVLPCGGVVSPSRVERALKGWGSLPPCIASDNVAVCAVPAAPYPTPGGHVCVALGLMPPLGAMGGGEWEWEWEGGKEGGEEGGGRWITSRLHEEGGATAAASRSKAFTVGLLEQLGSACQSALPQGVTPRYLVIFHPRMWSQEGGILNVQMKVNSAALRKLCAQALSL